MTAHAIRLETAGAPVTVVCTDKDVTDWTVRYIGPWWNAAEVAPESVSAALSSPRPWMRAVTPTSRSEEISAFQRVTYARAELLLDADASSGIIRAVSARPALAYQSDPGAGSLEVVGCRTEDVATATARLAREVMRGQLLRGGWAVLHASAVVAEGGRTVLTFGRKGAGKTTTALALAARTGCGLLANDRVFVRPNDRGGVDVLPWPSAAALGLGLLDALGWFEICRERLEAGEALHPTQDDRVTEALLAGRRTPLWEGGKELKVQVFPDQFPGWFGVPLATEGRPRRWCSPGGAGRCPGRGGPRPRLEDGDFMSGATEDRYPDVFALARVDGGGTKDARHEVAHRLAELPHHSVVLGHDVSANAGFLAKTIGCA
ncbi:hypothetical protein ACFQ3Z_45820 [Streptomyces nogalater]